MQAQATGLAVIATRHSGFPDQVVDGENGFLVNEGDYRALAERVVYFMEHPELWSRMSRAARVHVKKNYDSSVLIKKQIELYKKFLYSDSIQKFSS